MAVWIMDMQGLEIVNDRLIRKFQWLNIIFELEFKECAAAAAIGHDSRDPDPG
jgi:hypothetical protein